MPVNYFKADIDNAKRFIVSTSLKTKLLYLRRRLVRPYENWIPQQIWIGVTSKCQCSCVHCCVNGSDRLESAGELTKDEIFDLIDSARELGCLEVSFFGGEPLLKPELTQLVEYASGKGMLTTVFTNGLLLTQEKIRELKDVGLSYCNVSLDSGTPERHNQLRGVKKGFEHAVEGIRFAVEAGIACSIWTYVSKEDVGQNGLQDTKAVIELGRRLNVYKVVVLFPMASGNWLCQKENMLSLEERELVRKLHDPPFVSMEFPDEKTVCGGARNFLYVTPYGKVSPCPTIPIYYGNIRQEPLYDILKKLRKEFVESELKTCGECVMNQGTFREKIEQSFSA